LDYKVTIKASGEAEKKLPNSFLYFANNAIKNDREKKFMVKHNSIAIEFFSFNIKVVEAIKEYFAEFLLITNFGARSTKGYGSFSVVSDEKINEQKCLKEYYPIVFKVNSANINKWEEVVDTLHKRLKSGINFRSYHKSLLFLYMCQKNLRWEKRKIKEEFPSLATGKPPIDCDIQKEYRYIRAMLGVASINEYAVGRDRFTVTIEDKEKNIERFASPISYKIIDNNIYLLGDKSYEKIMGKTFSFTFEGKSFEIIAPKKDEFDLYEFLKFVEQQEQLISEVK